MDLVSIQRFIPPQAKYFLKPYYRKFFSNRLHILLWPTFRCNYRCSYCTVVTKYNLLNDFPPKSERRAEEWVAALEKLPPAMIYFAGGEPFLYMGLPDLVNNLPKKHQLLGIVSNVSQPTSAYRKIKRSFHLNASFHREFVSESDFVAKVKELQEFLDVHVNIVATKENLPVIASIDALLKTHRMTLHVDPLVDVAFRYSGAEEALLRKYTKADRSTLVQFDDFSAKTCSAGRNYLNLMPDGQAFTCAGGFHYTYSPLYAGMVENRPLGQFRLGNIFDSDFKLNSSDIVCELPCQHACDRDSVTMKSIEPLTASKGA